MNKGIALAGGAGLGAGLMFLLDPVAGNRRRALIRDKYTHMRHKTENLATSKMRHMRNKAKGMRHKMHQMGCPLTEEAEA